MGDITRKAMGLVDFTLNNKQGNKSSRRSVFQVFSPKMNPKNTLNQNQKEIFNATNNINSILSKNLKSLFQENKNDISQDIPLYQNVDCLIKKNNNSNRLMFNKIVNKNNLKRKQTDGTFIHNMSEDIFKNTDIRRFLKANSISRTSIKKMDELRKQLDSSSPLSKFNKKPISKFSSYKKRLSKLFNEQIINKTKKGFKKRNSTYDEDLILAINNSDPQKIIKENQNNSQGNKSSFFRQNFNFNNGKKSNNTNISNNNEIKDLDTNNTNNNIKIYPNTNRKRFSLKMDKADYTSYRNIIPKRVHRHSISSGSSMDSMRMPTLKQIGTNLTQTFIADKLKSIQKELDDYDNNEISEILNNLPKCKTDKKKCHKLTRLSLNQQIDINNSEIEKSDIKNKETIIDKNEIKDELEDDRFQKKYRKLFLNKNLYDSLDDEEIQDEEKIYILYISPHSATVYILDTLILLSSLVILYYLPIFLSFNLSSNTIYFNIFSSLVFYLIDFMYIIDLITGFFRAYYNFEEVLIKKKRDLCLNYIGGWFIFDLIEAIPFFTLLDNNKQKSRINFLSSNKSVLNMFDLGLNNKYFALTFLKLLKIFKIFSDNRAFIKFHKFLDKSQFFYEWKGIFSSILIIFSSLHFSTCFFIFLGKNEFPGWIVKNNLQDSSFGDIYIAALYYQMTTLTTVGYGDISATNNYEIIYGIFMLIVGTCAYSWILTYISNYIKKNNEKYIDFEKNMNVLNEIKLEYPNLGKDLYDRIIRYLNYNKSEHKFNLKFILESLPSSLQNNLIIEIYKPIIQNFQFFKSFENSDFFVKIVTSLKPILSMKDDILIQEGDIIEDIIFIKTGVLTLQVIIDLNDPIKSVESHLETTRMDYFQDISNNQFSNIINLNTLNMNGSNNTSEFDKPAYNVNYTKRKEIKIIDLRKNEHFGDILMILNEKSPLTVKVKSKKAELFFLEKTEATEISNRYSNIWKRIVNRSLHNMKQIKRLIRKKVLLFIESYNIGIDKKLKEKYSKKDIIMNTIVQDLNQKVNTSFETIKEEDESVSVNSQSNNTEKNLEQSTKEQTLSLNAGDNFENKITNLNSKYTTSKIIKDSNISQNYSKNDKKIDTKFHKINSFDKDNKQIYEKSDNKFVVKKPKKNLSFSGVNNVEINNNINKVNEMITIIDKEVKKSNKKNQINNFNINIYTPKLNFPLNSENQNSKRYNKEEKDDINSSNYLGKVNSEISYSNDLSIDLKHNPVLMDNSDENSNIVFSNVLCKDNKQNKNINNNDSRNINIHKLFNEKKIEKIIKKNNKNEKADIKTNDKLSNKSNESEYNHKIYLESKYHSDSDIKDIKHNKFMYLDTSLSTSFTINSSYENINEISNYKYDSSPDLREKTKSFILSQINNINTVKLKKTISSKIHSLKYSQTKDHPKKLSHKKTFRKKSYIIGSKKKMNEIINLAEAAKKSFILEPDNNIKPHLKLTKSINKPEVFSFKHEEEHNTKDLRFSSVIHYKRKKSLKGNKHIKKVITAKEKENNYYSKINRMRSKKNVNYSNFEEKSEKENSKLNFNDVIAKNIEKNQQNLNNPEEYFEGFFNNIILKQKKTNNLLDDTVKKKKTIKKHGSD